MPVRKTTPKKKDTILLPDAIVTKRNIEEEKKARANRLKQKHEKLQIIPGPVKLDWTVDPSSTDFFDAIDKIQKSQWSEFPEKGMGQRIKADIYQWRKSLPPLVMVTHLHAVFLNDSTFVEREIRSSCQRGDLRRLNVNVVDGGELVIKSDDYYRILDEWINEENRQVFESFKELLKQSPEALSLSIYDLESFPGLSEKRNLIMSAGFLTLQTGQLDEFNISIPNIGRYLKLVTSCRKWITTNLDKNPWKEMTEIKLNEHWISGKSRWKEFRGASLDWPLSDCYGGGWCEPFNTPMGRCWKLTGKK